MGLKKQMTLIVAILTSFSAWGARKQVMSPRAAEVRGVRIRTGPSLYLNKEGGVLYQNTGKLPAKLEMLCGSTKDGEETPCGEVDVNLSMRAYGAMAYFLNFTRKNALVIELHLDPHEAVLGDVLGGYTGGRVGGGVGFGARGMLLLNTSSGVWANSVQFLTFMAGQDPRNAQGGIDISAAILEVSCDATPDVLNRPLDSFAG